jgi:TRAP-type C4-dicarboxylate transport system permease small subunit
MQTETSSFKAEDDEVDLSQTRLEGWVALAFFWLLGLTVCHQFFTRYVLNDSAGWTEEIARYLLIATVFVGMAIGVRKNDHIRVDFFFRLMPAQWAKWLYRAVDVLSVVFYLACIGLTWLLMEKMGNYQMTIIDLPMNIIYGICLLGFVLCAWRALQVLWQHWRSDYLGYD